MASRADDIRRSLWRELILAEVVRRYSQFQIPDLKLTAEPANTPEPSLIDQAAGRSVLFPANDFEREPRDRHTRRLAKREEVIRLYRQGYSLNAIQRICHLRWLSIAEMLAEAGERRLRKS